VGVLERSHGVVAAMLAMHNPVVVRVDELNEQPGVLDVVAVVDSAAFFLRRRADGMLSLWAAKLDC